MCDNSYAISRINFYLEAREKLDAVYLDAILTGKFSSYSFNSGEGSQQTTYRSLDEVMKQIDWLDSRIDWMIRKCGPGGGLISINLRRSSYNYPYKAR